MGRESSETTGGGVRIVLALALRWLCLFGHCRAMWFAPRSRSIGRVPCDLHVALVIGGVVPPKGPWAQLEYL